MPIRLKTPQTSAEPLPLYGGKATLLVRPATAVDVDLAGITARRTLRELHDGLEGVRLYGMALPSIDADTISPDVIEGMADLVTMVELAMLVTSGVEGIEREDGTAADVSRETFAALFLDLAPREAFRNRVLRGVHEVVREGNGFAPSPSGGGAEASPIASAAETPTSPAPAASPAPTGSTARNTNTPRPQRKA